MAGGKCRLQKSCGPQDPGDAAGPAGPGRRRSVGQPPPGEQRGQLLQGVLAQGEKFLIGVGSVHHVGEGLHLVRPQHGHDGAAGGQVLVHAGRDHVAVRVPLPEAVEQHLTPGQVKGDLHLGTGGQEGDVVLGNGVGDGNRSVVRNGFGIRHLKIVIVNVPVNVR